MGTWCVDSLSLEEVGDLLIEQLKAGPETWQTSTTIGGILSAVERGQHQLWGIFDPDSRLRMLLLSRIERTPSHGIFVIWWATGGLDAVASTPLLEDLASQAGCLELQIAGRRGWERVMRPLGFEFRYTVVGKRVGEKDV